MLTKYRTAASAPGSEPRGDCGRSAELLTTIDLARALGGTEATVHQLLYLGRLPGHKIGHTWVCNRDEFDRFVREVTP